MRFTNGTNLTGPNCRSARIAWDARHDRAAALRRNLGQDREGHGVDTGHFLDLAPDLDHLDHPAWTVLPFLGRTVLARGRSSLEEGIPYQAAVLCHSWGLGTGFRSPARTHSHHRRPRIRSYLGIRRTVGALALVRTVAAQVLWQPVPRRGAVGLGSLARTTSFGFVRLLLRVPILRLQLARTALAKSP
jgi:hypothetical protein